MKKVLITGYFGYGNAGDELILDYLIKILKSEIKDVQISVLSAKPLETIFAFKIRSANRWNPISVLREISKTDMVICSGGLYQDKTGNLSLYYYLALIVAAKLLRKKVVLCGVGFEPIKHTYNKWILAYVMKFVDKIGARTEGSKIFLEKLKLKSNVVLTADIVYSPLVKHKSKIASDSIKKIVMILSRPEYSVDFSVKLLSRLCESLHRRLNAEIIFVPFHIDEDFEYNRKIAQTLPFGVRIIRWQYPQDLFDVLSECDFIISQRLHGLIVGSILGIPVMGVSNEPKLKFFFDELNQKHFILDRIIPERITEIVLDVYNWRNDFKNLTESKIRTFQYRSYLNINLVNGL